jgi:hypothetical protein
LDGTSFSVLSKPSSQWEEGDLLGLIRDGVQEGDRLDYKRELLLADARSRAELAKDVSSLANTTGGRLIYGMAEGTGEKSAIPLEIAPLTDPALPDRLIDVIYERCLPNVRIGRTSVPVEGGYCLVVDVPESLAPIMVVGKGQNRFYKRYERKSVPMNERDVRERYERLTRARDIVEGMLDTAGPTYAHPSPWWTGKHPGFLTLLLVPVFGPVDLFDPASFRPPRLRQLLAVQRSDLWRYMGSARPTFFGCEFCFDNPEHLLAFLRLHRNGVSEFHYTLAVRDGHATFHTVSQADLLLDALEALEAIYRVSGYFGDLRVVADYRNLDGYDAWIDREARRLVVAPRPLTYSMDTSVETLSEHRLQFVRGLLNRIAQAAGEPVIRFPLADGRNAA